MHTEIPSFPSSRGARWRHLLARALRSDVAWLAGCALAIAGGLQLAGLAASRYIAPLPPAPTIEQHVAATSMEQAGNELLYRACVREARVHSLPVKPYPQENERVSFVREGKRLMKQTETMEADISDMSVENGCQVTLLRRVQTEPADDAARDLRKMSMQRPDKDEQSLQVPLGANSPPAPACVLQRDVALQSHYMLLNLCMLEYPAGQAPGAPAQTGRKAVRVLKRPTT